MRIPRFACAAFAILAAVVVADAEAQQTNPRPNILFCIADDWGWPHAGAYGDDVVKTPTFDRLAREGVLCENAYVSSPSCTPSRGAILTGRFHWQLSGAANLYGVFPDRFETYPEMLADSGYIVGRTGKAWGPGRPERSGRALAGPSYRDFDAFLAERNGESPFCFWLGTSDPHRPYKKGSGEESGIDISEVELPACYPDSDVIRSDIADYYFEVQRFDSLVGRALASLEKAGELDNTVVVMTGDHGMPFPRGKSNLYDLGARVPLAIRWPDRVPGGREVTDFVSLVDLAPTFLEASGGDADEETTGRSLMPILTSDREGRVSDDRESIVFGKERHVPSQEGQDMGGYPSRAIRTDSFLLIHNYAPERWPNGTPNYKQAAIENAWYADTDNGPTKSYIIENKDRDREHRRSYELCFAKRPSIELYDLERDPGQVNNVARQGSYQDEMLGLVRQLNALLEATEDPRAVGNGRTFDGLTFDEYPYIGGAPKYPGADK